jgi:stage V sporulation protein S
MEILKVSAKSSPNAVAGAIAGCIRSEGAVQLDAVGAGAVNVVVKAIIIARGFMEPVGVELVCVPSFIDIKIEGEERTAVRFTVQTK